MNATAASACAGLARFALDVLWLSSQYEGCCPRCCAACGALNDLRNRGELSTLLLHDPESEGSAWWNENEDGVDEFFLAVAWRKTECHAEI